MLPSTSSSEIRAIDTSNPLRTPPKAQRRVGSIFAGELIERRIRLSLRSRWATIITILREGEIMGVKIASQSYISLGIIALMLLILTSCSKKASMEGKVVDGSSHPLNSVTVVAKQLEPIKGYEEARAVTSADGAFQLSKLYPESFYELHVEGKNWISHSKDYDTIKAGPKGETSLLAAPVQVTMAVTQSGSLVMDLETGICRFEKSPEGHITDATTALQWHVLPGKITWFQASDRIRQMGDGWRMPRMNELKSLYVKGLGTCNIDPVFDLLGGSIYWVWSDYLKRLPFNLTISHSFHFLYGIPSQNGGEPDANNDKMQAFAVRSLEGP
jgi:hypothetical protein